MLGADPSQSGPRFTILSVHSRFRLTLRRWANYGICRARNGRNRQLHAIHAAVQGAAFLPANRLSGFLLSLSAGREEESDRAGHMGSRLLAQSLQVFAEQRAQEQGKDR
jgi:hypothetical protein